MMRSSDVVYSSGELRLYVCSSKVPRCCLYSSEAPRISPYGVSPNDPDGGSLNGSDGGSIKGPDGSSLNNPVKARVCSLPLTAQVILP